LVLADSGTGAAVAPFPSITNKEPSKAGEPNKEPSKAGVAEIELPVLPIPARRRGSCITNITNSASAGGRQVFTKVAPSPRRPVIRPPPVRKRKGVGGKKKRSKLQLQGQHAHGRLAKEKASPYSGGHNKPSKRSAQRLPNLLPPPLPPGASSDVPAYGQGPQEEVLVCHFPLGLRAPHVGITNPSAACEWVRIPTRRTGGVVPESES
jgi:hypothetical protein